MAQGGKEHRMLFDIRGKRRHVVKVVYAILALLMGLSLFLVTGGLNLGSLFESANNVSSATKGLEEQTQRIQRKVRQDPQNPDLLLALTRAQINTGNTMLTTNSETGGLEFTPEAQVEFEHASESWDRYLKTAEKPNPGAAAVVASTLFRLAEKPGSTFGEINANVRGAIQAQQIAAADRPTLNSLSTLGIYQLYGFEYGAAKKTEEEAKKLTSTKFEREQLENQFKEISKRAHEFQNIVKESEKAAKAGGNSGAGKESLENPLGGLGGTGLSGE
jgi:hypothetical protein